MILSTNQITQLHYHINKKQIKYTEVRDEVLDHYQTALEMENKKSMEEVLTELDQTFTITYCKALTELYINELRSEYPLLIKRKVLEMFAWKRLPVTLFILVAGLSVPYFFPNPKSLVHLLNVFFLSLMSLESFMIQKSYPKNTKKHCYRPIDDKPTLARSQARSLRGWGVFPAISYLILMVPLLVIYLGDLEGSTLGFLFSPPYIYSICLLSGLTILFQFANFEVSRDRNKPVIR